MFDTADAWIARPALFGGGLFFFLIFELLRPYRMPLASKAKRWLTNLSLAGFNAVFIRLVFGVAMTGILSFAAERRGGLLDFFEMPYWSKILSILVFMDFTLWVWHLLNHKVPVLWRFHRVHHCDPEMDVSTATRFHAGELAISALIRMGLVLLLGADFFGMLVFETATVAAAQFHHSSLDIPSRLEAPLWLLFVPPSMHRIHHSVRIKERDSNYGVIFSLWDRIMGTFLRDVEQDGIRIGVGAYPNPEKLGFRALLAMPFEKPVR